MEQIRAKAGVFAIVAILAVFIILYSLWGASLLRQQALTSGTASAVATNF